MASAGPAGLGGPPAEEADSSADEEVPRPHAGNRCQGSWCAEQEAERGVERGRARKGSTICARCYHRDRLDELLRTLRDFMWEVGRRNLTWRNELVAGPVDPQRVQRVHLQGVQGATAQRVEQVLRRAGLTVRRRQGGVAGPIPTAAWRG